MSCDIEYGAMKKKEENHTMTYTYIAFLKIEKRYTHKRRRKN
jgi:hypothetical protein